MQGGTVQAETATVMMFDEELQTKSTPPTDKLLINDFVFLCYGVMVQCDCPKTLETCHNVIDR